MIRTRAKTGTKSDVRVSRSQQKYTSQSPHLPYEHILFLQKTIGNQAVKKLIPSGILRAKEVSGPTLENPLGTYGNKDLGLHRIGEERIQGGFFGDIWGGIKSAASAVWRGAKTAGGAIWTGIKAAGEWSWGAMKSIGRWGVDVLKSAGAWVWDLVTEAPNRIWRLLEHIGSGIVGIISGLWNGFKGALGHIWNAATGIFRWATKGVEGLFSWIWEGLKGGGKWAWKLLHGDFSGFWEGIGGFFSWLGGGVVNLAKWGWEGLQAALIWGLEGVKGVGKWIWNGFLSSAAWIGRLFAKLLDLTGFGEIMDLIWQIIKVNTRSLTSGEIGEAKKVFGGSINYWQVRIDEHSLIAWIGSLFKGGGGMGVTTFHTINFNRKISPAPGNSDMAWLIHEMTHVFQMERVGMQYMGEAIHAQATIGYEYGGTAGLIADRAAGKRFRDYNREQQAQIAQDYYPKLYAGHSTAAYDPFIRELRAGDL